ncbi:hypothetical protein [Edaphocola aurantiacus]|uniref:hypothetical protein n=1 Tax=Edaphocola aurantiacus TaxID=2601682 RepID=UPI001C96E355|nr:hypothetical protein [Edaphocola aurantiacus]
MKYILGTLCFLFSISSNCQMTKSLFCYNKLQSDSILNYFLNTKDSIKINRNCIVLNINYTDLEEIDSSNIKKYKPVLDLKNSLLVPIIIDTLQKEVLFSINKDSDSLYLGYKPVLDKDFKKNFKYVQNRYDLSKIKIYKIPTMPNEFYVLIDSKIYVVHKNRLYDLKKYILKKYGHDELFIEKYKKSLSVH